LGKHEQLGEDIFLELPKKITTFSIKTAMYYVLLLLVSIHSFITDLPTFWASYSSFDCIGFLETIVDQELSHFY
jgi:hypothetical protein